MSTMQIKRGSSSVWESSNAHLAEGQLGLEYRSSSGNPILKVGKLGGGIGRTAII